MSVNVCVPVLKRYDLLRGMLLSLRYSTVKPEAVYILNNGRDETRLKAALSVVAVPAYVQTPTERGLGVAESWNWFIRNAPEDRIIVNDDIIFSAESISKLIAPKADLIFAKDCGFSCFVIRDQCVEKLGLFDEEISPGYGYYEDEDYLQRLDGRGTREPSAVMETVDAGVTHLKSQTLESNTPAEWQEHHRKFKIAQGNYSRKWGVAF